MHQFTIEDKKSLAAGLGACLVVQRTYGKQGSDLQTMVNIFCGALKEYEPEKVIEAVQKWLTESDEFPTPNNIKQLIDPKPQFCRVTYMDISDRRRRGDFVSDDEVKYQKLYRNHMMKGL